jgi:hypothetical protein
MALGNFLCALPCFGAVTRTESVMFGDNFKYHTEKQRDNIIVCEKMRDGGPLFSWLKLDPQSKVVHKYIGTPYGDLLMALDSKNPKMLRTELEKWDPDVLTSTHPHLLHSAVKRLEDPQKSRRSAWVHKVRKIITILVDFGYDIDAKNKNGWTPVAIAEGSRAVAAKKKLLELGANRDYLIYWDLYEIIEKQDLGALKERLGEWPWLEDCDSETFIFNHRFLLNFFVRLLAKSFKEPGKRGDIGWSNVVRRALRIIVEFGYPVKEELFRKIDPVKDKVVWETLMALKPPVDSTPIEEEELVVY